MEDQVAPMNFELPSSLQPCVRALSHVQLFGYEYYTKRDESSIPYYEGLIWGAMLSDARKMGLDVDFAEEHLKKFSSRLFSRASQLPCILKHEKCYACPQVSKLLGDQLKDMKNPYEIASFQRLNEEWGKGDGRGRGSIPSYLAYVPKGIVHDVTANTSFCDPMIVSPCGLFYAVIDEMHNMKLKDITDEYVLLKWGAVIRDAGIMELDVKFAEEHLKKIAHAYFLSSNGGAPAAAAAESAYHQVEAAICTMSETECFDDDAPLSKGILFPPTN